MARVPFLMPMTRPGRFLTFAVVLALPGCSDSASLGHEAGIPDSSAAHNEAGIPDSSAAHNEANRQTIATLRSFQELADSLYNSFQANAGIDALIGTASGLTLDGLQFKDAVHQRFDYNTTLQAYQSAGVQADVPSDAVRFTLYSRNPSGNGPSLPLSIVGYADVIDRASTPDSAFEVVVVVNAAEMIRYRTSGFDWLGSLRQAADSSRWTAIGTSGNDADRFVVSLDHEGRWKPQSFSYYVDSLRYRLTNPTGNAVDVLMVVGCAGLGPDCVGTGRTRIVRKSGVPDSTTLDVGQGYCAEGAPPLYLDGKEVLYHHWTFDQWDSLDIVGRTFPRFQHGCNGIGTYVRDVLTAFNAVRAPGLLALTAWRRPPAELKVVVTTSGPLPAAGYTVTELDPPLRGAHSSGNDTVTFEGVPAGDHDVHLADVPLDCIFPAGDTKTATVTAQQTTYVTFAVQCGFPGARAGELVAFADGVDVIKLSGERTLLPGLYGTQDVRWSPDGSWLVVSASRPYPEQVYSVRPDGTELVRIATGGQARWSPDGLRIAFTRPLPNAGAHDVFVASPEGSTEADVTNDPSEYELAPTWAGNDRIRYVGSAGDGYDVYEIALNGGTAKKITTFDNASGGVQSAAEPSPDGTLLAVCATGLDGEAAVYVMRTDGTELKRFSVPAKCEMKAGPAWSPDGTRIAFTSAGGFVYIAARDGSGMTKLAAGAHPSWSPDGQRLAWDRSGSISLPDINVGAADGSWSFPLTQGVYGGYPRWRPQP